MILLNRVILARGVLLTPGSRERRSLLTDAAFAPRQDSLGAERAPEDVAMHHVVGDETSVSESMSPYRSQISKDL